MKKKDIVQYLVDTYDAKKVRFKEYDVSFSVGEKEYVVKIIKTTNTNQVTINSTIIWEIKQGRLDGIRYKVSSSRMLDLSVFQTHPNKIILFTETPYRVLRYLNESDVIDVSDKNEVYGIYYLDDPVKIADIL